MSCARKLFLLFLPIFAIVAVIASTPNAVLGAITHSGDISPSELSSWTAATVGYIGTTGDQTYSAGTGTVEITGGTLNSNSCYLGYIANTSGTLTVDGTGSMLTNNYSLGHHGGIIVGLGGAGTLYVTNGGNISSESGSVFGISAGSTGAGTVTGDGSTWTLGSWLCVGSSGTGTISITNGGYVRSVSGAIGNSSGAAGTVTVNGYGSMWENTSTGSSAIAVGVSGDGVLNVTGGAVATAGGSVIVGKSSGGGNATLNIADNGAISAAGLTVYSKGLLAIEVANGSGNGLLSVTGAFTNRGKVRIIAGAGHAAGTITPISASSWTGSGTYQAVGGKWSTSLHSFTVSAVQSGMSGGTGTTIDLATTQRVLIEDGGTGWALGASFLTASGSQTFTATAIADFNPIGEEVLGAWSLSATKAISLTNPAYLSFDIGEGYSQDELAVWHYDGSVWTPYNSSYLTYDGTYAGFGVTSFSGYAVTAPVAIPEPATLAMLLAVGAGLLICAWRKRK